VARSAATYLERLDGTTQRRIARKLAELAEGPFDPQHSKPLANAVGWRSARVGGWRILFTVDPQAGTVQINRIAPRGQVYRDL